MRSGWEQQRVRKQVMRRHRAICHWCGLPGADQVDHVVNLASGGTDSIDNLRPIHRKPCHLEKTAAEARRGRGGGG